MSTWRECKALVTLLKEVNQKWPTRSKVSDGTIGDMAHQHRISDHDPNSNGVVCAMDITNDPAHGLISRKLAEELINSRDARIKYVISNRQICSGVSGPSPWVWRTYTGANPHEHHMHISVRTPANYYDDDRAWDLSGITPAHPVPVVVPIGSTKWIQHELNARGAGPKLQEDGYEGQVTQAAIRAFAVDKLKGLK